MIAETLQYVKSKIDYANGLEFAQSGKSEACYLQDAITGENIVRLACHEGMCFNSKSRLEFELTYDCGTYDLSFNGKKWTKLSVEHVDKLIIRFFNKYIH